MKSLGMARKVDDLGRIVLPVEMRRLLNISEGDHLEISVDANQIILVKLEERCVFCSSADGLREFRDKRVCSTCAHQLSRGDNPIENQPVENQPAENQLSRTATS